jgi:UDP-N-acetylmuramyl pentapeptide synthase
VALGLGLAEIRAGLQSLSPVSGRMQRRATPHGGVLIDDTYNANPGSVRAAIDSLATFAGTRVLVLGNMAELGERSRELHAEIGAHARQRGIEQLLVCGQDADAVAAGFGAGARVFGDRADLEAACREFDRAGSVILVKGSRSAGMEAVVAALVEAEPALRERRH